MSGERRGICESCGGAGAWLQNVRGRTSYYCVDCGNSSGEPLINAALQLADWSEEDDPMQDEWNKLWDEFRIEAAKYRSES